MKKILIICLLMVGFAGIAAAQTTDSKKHTTVKSPANKADKKTTTTVQSSSKTTNTQPTTTANKETVASPNANPGEKKNKNGTPDMRYKENKVAAKATGPKKKNGTRDMRYKVNKEKQKTKG